MSSPSPRQSALAVLAAALLILQALRSAAFDASTTTDPFSPDYDALARAADPKPSTVLWTHEIVPASDPSATPARGG